MKIEEPDEPELVYDDYIDFKLRYNPSMCFRNHSDNGLEVHLGKELNMNIMSLH